jgi:hypothetical protein
LSLPVHRRGSYLRSLRDAPLAGVPVLIRLRVRRFRCRVDCCERRTFVEQVPDLTTRTPSLTMRVETKAVDVRGDRTVRVGWRSGFAR